MNDSSHGVASSHLERLIDGAREGDAVAMARLIRRYYPYLMRIANREFPRRLRGRIGPSDIVQDALLKLQTCFAKFSGASEPQLRMWLRRTLRNCMENARRHHTSLRREVARDRDVQELQKVPRGKSPSRQLLRRELTGAVVDALYAMPPLQQQVLYLRHCEARSFAEISALLNKSPDATRMIWWRGLQFLREQFTDSLEDSTRR